MDQMAGLLVFTPDRPGIYVLNDTSWLILELCDGRRRELILEQYAGIVGPVVPRDKAQEEFEAAVMTLEQMGLIQAAPQHPAAAGPGRR
ncbi:MAG TPA: PqqD family protein [Actinocrinis sp.]|uniref:PqqD family protein n=1 Tax=Actinocrinis sp. TaxID=1920516 RepID=UPI002DDDBA58|nr:PqqD family protein [Actinocrinis sp.]HEV2344910.1 PqqD family protein [Actinocrinis sp.]